MIKSINLILLGIVIISGFAMLHYLRAKGFEKSRIYTFNPLFILDYIQITKKEMGHYGIWFWGFLVSFLALMVLGIIELLLY